MFGNEEVLQTDNMENISDNTNEEKDENFKKKQKEISKTDEATYE